MARINPHARDRAAWELANRQHQLIARSQLIELGFTREAIQHRVETGRLFRVHRGVYSKTRRLARQGEWMAAVLACGPGAALSHDSAAAHYGIRNDRSRVIHVSLIAAGDRRSRSGIRVHRRCKTLTEADMTIHDGIPVTSIVVTLADLATFVDDTRLERAVNKADATDLIDPEALREAIEGMTCPGAARLRRLLDRHTFAVTESVLEQRFLQIVGRAGLPLPETQRNLGSSRVDFYWPELKLVVECDSLRYHRTAAQQSNDRKRDHAHVRAGLSCLRFTHYEVFYEEDEVERTLAVYSGQKS